MSIAPFPSRPRLAARAAAALMLLLLAPYGLARAADPNPSWRILALIYQTTDFSYRDAQGVDHRVIGSLTQQDIVRAEEILRYFTTVDVPQLSSGNQYPTLSVRVRPALTKLTRVGQRSWYPAAPTDLGADRDPAFDTIIAIWQTMGTDQFSGRREELSPEFGGLASYYPNAHTYVSASVFGANLWGFGRNLLKHEWGHNILAHFDSIGASPKPAVDNHINSTTSSYVNCLTGAPYVLLDETDAAPIPNSIYNNHSGFTHDYFSGTTARAQAPTQCLGITPTAWARGGPVTKTVGPTPLPPGIPAPPGTVTAAVAGTTVTLSWPSSPGATSYRLSAGTTPQASNVFNGTVGATTVVTAPNVPSGTYYVRVYAANSFGESAASAEAMLQVGSGAPCTTPPAPALAGSVTGTSVALAWNSIPGITGYTLEALSATSGALLARIDLSSGTTSYAAAGVPPGSYRLRVRAVTICGPGGPSNDVVLDVR
jgi:hypothetical protein